MSKLKYIIETFSPNIKSNSAGSPTAPPKINLGGDEPRRRHYRRKQDKCVAVIEGVSKSMPYPILDWSLGGLLINADERLFQFKKTYNMTLKFLVGGNQVVAVNVQAVPVRADNTIVAFEFKTISEKAKKIISDVIMDELHQSNAVDAI